MFQNIEIKKEIKDDLNDYDIYSNTNRFCYSLEDYNNVENSEPPKKVMKTRVDELLESMSSEKMDDIKHKRYDIEKHFNDKESNAAIDKKYKDNNYINLNNINVNQKSKSISMVDISYESFLQELFSWNPEWLQGRAFTKPPIKKFESQMSLNPFKVDYSRDEYISRHLPFIQSELFIKLSDSFKNDAPSRSKHDLLINDYETCDDSEINRRLICFSLRDLSNNTKPICKVNDIVILQLNVTTNGEKRYFNKQYFGVVVNHSMLELNELDPQVMQQFIPQTNNHKPFLCDKYIIITKRSRETNITIKQIARIEVIINAGFELRQAENLLFNNWKITKLLSNIFNAIGNIHQFSQSELEDNESVRKTLSQNAIDMITKANPMVYFKGVNNIMVVDVSDEKQRLDFLFDIVAETIENFNSTNGKIKFLVIAKNDDLCVWWREAMKRASNNCTHIRPWSLDNGRGWTRHEEVRRYTKHNAVRIQNSCIAKLNKMSSNSKSFEELGKRKDCYQRIIESISHFGNKGSAYLTPSAVIAREELLLKGYERLLKDCNVIIGTFENIINCQLLFKETNHSKALFDCCVIDDAQSLPDSYILSIIHSGVKSILISGDSDGFALCNNPNAIQQKFDISLFNRIFMKCLKI